MTTHLGHVVAAITNIGELGLDVLARRRAVLAEGLQPIVRGVVDFHFAGVVVGDEYPAVRSDGS